MRTLARCTRRDWLVLGPACAAILVGLVLAVPWAMHGPVLHHLWITWQYLLNGTYIVLMYNLQVTQEDLWKTKRKRTKNAVEGTLLAGGRARRLPADHSLRTPAHDR